MNTSTTDNARTTAMTAASWLIAHRGYPALYPENTREGVHAALAGGALHVEFDVHLSADGVPVVIHDDTLQRTGNHSGKVHDMPYAELLQAQVGEPARFGDRYSDVRVVSLAAMLEIVAGFPGATAWVELKRGSMRHFGRDAVVNAVIPELQQARCPLVVLSFDAEMISRIRADTGLPIGWVFQQWNKASRSELEQLQPDYVLASAEVVPVNEHPFWPGEWCWAIYDVNDATLALKLRERGADMIETDRILDMLAELAP